MDILNIALLLGAAGIGGAVGAAASALVAGSRVQAATAEFEAVFDDYFDGREDPDSRRVRASFASLKDALMALSGTLGKLKRAIRIR